MKEEVPYVAEPLSDSFNDATAECAEARKNKGIAGIRTGFAVLDGMSSGMRKGQLWTIGGSTGSGKSALALCIARNVVKDITLEKIPDIYFASLEMGRTDLIHRLVAISTGMDLLNIISWKLTPDEMRKYMNAMGEEKRGAGFIHVDDRSRLTLADIKKQLDILSGRVNPFEIGDGAAAAKRLGLVIVDYLQLVTPSKSNAMREREVSESVRGLKEIAREYGVPVIGCSQLNRQYAVGEEPQLWHLRESGEIEHASDVVVLIGAEDGGVSHMKLAKGRSCKKGPFDLSWTPACTRFADLSRREEPAMAAQTGWSGYD